MKAVNSFILGLALLFFAAFSVSDAGAADAGYSARDHAFKRAYLDRLTPYGPGVNLGLGSVWRRFIHMAAKYEDYDIARKMFDVRFRVGGAMQPQYARDLLKLYRANPAFFVRAANRHFNGDYSMILGFWFDGTGEVSLIDLQGPAKRARGSRLVRRFMKQADSADQRMMSMN